MKKYILMIPMIILLAGLAACGGQETAADGADVSQEEYVYVPEFAAFDMAKNLNDYETRLQGDKLYQFNYLYDLDTMKGTDQFQVLSLAGEVLLEIALGGNGSEGQYSSERLLAYDADAEGNVYTVEWAQAEQPDGSRITDYYLCCYNDSGSKVFSRDIAADLREDENRVNVDQLVLDKGGRIYVMCETTVKLFEQDGSPAGSISVVQEGSLYTLSRGSEGDVYVFYRESHFADDPMWGAKIDFEAVKLGEAFGNLPGGWSDGDVCQGVEGDFFVNDGSKVYEYDIETQSYEAALTWLDCNIIGSHVSRIGLTGEGELFAVIEDWSAGTMEVAFLKRLNASEVAPKTGIVLGLFYEDRDIQAAAVAFNRKNEKYQVVLRVYADRNAGESYEDGLTRLNLDITAGDSPDILELSQLDIEALTLSGALEDLGPYLEGSSVLDREDYLENVLAGYTYGDKLAAIPHSFTMMTIAGRTSELGEEMGWTLEEMLDYGEEHPQAKLISSATKSSVMEFCMSCSMELFLDWESGEVKFDSEIFKRLLEYVNRYPDAFYPQEDTPDTTELLQSGELLLYPCNVDYFNALQLYPAMFDQPVTFVGYPTADGSATAVLYCDRLYGISAASDNKEGAWAFIESWLSRPVEYGFSPRRSQLEVQIEEAKECRLDANGEPILGGDGNPIPAYGYEGAGGRLSKWQYTYHVPTDEEIGWVEELLLVAKPLQRRDSQVLAIIEEEVQAFYAGQKSAEDVARTIQSRVQNYVDEKR